MQYLDRDVLDAIDLREFRGKQPFPWVNVHGCVRTDAFRRLCENLPDVSLFPLVTKRSHGYGDRFELQYRPSLKLPQLWHDFAAELSGPEYSGFIRRLFQLPVHHRFELTMHWHYARSGFSLSPHVDARRKIGSHIFYLNTAADWDPTWGGQTVVLDDGGAKLSSSRPDFSEFQLVAAPETMDNRSMLFQRNDRSWHGVRPLSCPPDRMRKVFIVVINRINLQVLWRRVRGKDPDGQRLS